jgi:3-oxoacyl-[acyl-carrier protein] reductase
MDTLADNPVAIVTGGARGLGAAIALRLAQDGYDIALLDIDLAACADTLAAIRALGRLATAVRADVADEDSVTAAVAEVNDALGPALVLINNAGLMRPRVAQKMSLSEWNLVIDVNLRGTFLMSRAVVPAMRNSGWGRIVNISSTAALGLFGGANYASAKAGIQGLTKTLALELGRYGVTVNSVAPGFVVTDLTRKTAEDAGVTIEEMERSMIAEIAVGRVGNPEDITHAVSFFVAKQSSFVSGQVLYVAGGPKA